MPDVFALVYTDHRTPMFRWAEKGTDMFAKVIATTAFGASLALGVAGVAGAAVTGGTTTGGSGTTQAARCAKAPAALARLRKLDARYQAWLPKAEQREAAAKNGGHDAQAARIQGRIDRAEKAYQKGESRYQKIEAACPGATGTTGGSTGTSSGGSTGTSSGGSTGTSSGGSTGSQPGS
jgi:uncharacterized membrane protein YgcG